MSVAQHQILGNKFDIGNSPFISFDIKAIAMFIAEMSAHFLAHFPHFRLQSFTFTRQRHNLATHCVKVRGELRIAVHYTRTHQRLMFPRPGLVFLIIGKCFCGCHQHSRRPGRTQSSIHFIQNAGRGTRTEQMHNALRQTQIKLPPVDFPLTVSHRIHWAIMEEDKVKIGTVA